LTYRTATIYDNFMALSRKEEFPERDLTLADWCKAISHPARIAILRTLASRGECICGDLVLDLPLAQSTVSQHLKALKEAGLIQGEIDGPRSKYCINKKNFEKFIKAFGDFGIKLTEKLSDESCEMKGSRK
jgi:ArsR family transcriptional regulator